MKRIIITVTAAVGILGIVCFTLLMRTFENEAAVRVNIPRDATTASVRDSITASLGDSYGNLVYNLWKFVGNPASSHGSYLIEPGTTAMSAARRLASGRETPVKVTINNVRTMSDLTRRMSARLEVTPDEIDKAFATRLGERFGGKAAFPAAVLPDTYEFYWSSDADNIVDKLVAEYDRFWNSQRLDKAAELGLTPVEVATIASIVEEESNKKDERPTIARLYMNRISKGMKLQADPTVKFAVGNFGLRRITEKHLRIDSPYNTYKNHGLPPGPIRIPEKGTIDAVLDAPQNPYLYMCAKEDFSGYHNFASDYKTHIANAARYRTALDRRGIH